MKAKSSANVHIEVGVVDVMEAPKQRDKMQSDVPPPIGVIHQQHADREREPVRQRHEMEQTEMVLVRPYRSQQRNRHERNASERETRGAEERVAREPTKRREILGTQGPLPLHEKQNDEERSENDAAKLVQERRGFGQGEAIHERVTQNASCERGTVSIIIPALNEAATLAATIASIGDSAAEIIVVDAASSDRTVQIATESGARVVRSCCQQRAFQLNVGAKEALSETLLFLHADTLLPPGALGQIRRALERRDVVGGAFVRKYASSSPVLRATCFLARCRNHLIGWHLGDQAMFVRRSAFSQLGGFREVAQFEDLDLSRRLTRLGRVVTLHPGVTSSSRRFKQGAVRRTMHDVWLTIDYLVFGLPQARR